MKVSKHANETIIIRRRANNRIVVRHTIDGNLVGRAEVRKHADDVDNFLVGAKCAIDKMQEYQDKFSNLVKRTAEYPDNDPRSLKVGDVVYCKRSILDWSKNFVATLNFQFEDYDWQVTSSDGQGYCVNPYDILGKIVPCGELKAGDEVLVKNREELCFSIGQDKYENKIIKVDMIDYNFHDGEYSIQSNGINWHYPSRFVGKLIRFQNLLSQPFR